MLQLPENLFSNLTCNPWEIDPGAIGEGADLADIGHRIVVKPAIIRRGSGGTRRVGGVDRFKVGVRGLGRLIAIAEKRKLDAARPDISNLERHARGEGCSSMFRFHSSM